MDDPLDAPDRARVPALVRTLVRLMDDAIRIPGTNIRIGWDAVLGFFLPAAGDAVTALSQVALLIAAVRARAPGVVIARMVLNVAIDTVFGSIPLVGDLFDVGFKANRKNLELLDRLEHVGSERRAPRASDYAVLAVAIAGVLALIAAPIALTVWLFSRFA